MSDLTEFLLARIAEDEADAREAMTRNGGTWTTDTLMNDSGRINGTVDPGNPRAYGGDLELWDDEGALGMFMETAAHIARHDPARVLAEVEAKRRIVEACEHDDWTDPNHVFLGAPGEGYPGGEVLAALAAIYADHPDYDEAWRV